MTDIRPFPLRSFDDEVQVQAELARAREEVKAVLAERDRIREQARREGLEEGRQAAVEAAAKAERERVVRETAGLADLLKKTAEGIEACRRELVAAAERDLVALALAIARKVVKAEAESGKRIAPANLRRAIELSARRQEIKVLINPADIAMVEAYLPDLRREFSDLKDIALEASPSVGRGGVIVQSREGSVDAELATQLDEIERGLLG